MFIRGTISEDPEQLGTMALPPGADRRMAKIQRATCQSMYAALNKTGTTAINAIYAATALGCLEDTERFLDEITGPSTSLRSPLPFMRSTHNTMAGQLALLLKVHGPNITYSQSLFSFHAVLLNAMLHLEEEPSHTVAAFAADERTDLSNALVQANVPGTFLGEGVASFILGGTARAGDVARITRVEQRTIMDAELGTIVEQEKIGSLFCSSLPADSDLPKLSSKTVIERCDPARGSHGAQTALSLSIVLDRIASQRITYPCMILDEVGHRRGIIVVVPC